MCLFFYRRHTETSTEGVQAGGVMVVFIAKVVKHDLRHPAGEPTGDVQRQAKGNVREK